MKQILSFLLLVSLCALLPAEAMKNIHGWNTWQRPGDAGKFERIAPNAEFPNGTLKFLPETGRYAIQTYGTNAASPDQCKRYTVSFTSSADVNSDATAGFHLSAKDAAGAWYRIFTPPIATSLTVVPGTRQQMTLEVDLKAVGADKIAAICPTLTVNGLKTGNIVINDMDAETSASTWTPPAGPAVPGLPGFAAVPGALKTFHWPAPIPLQKFAHMMDFTAIGVNIIKLTPAMKAAALQWPDGRTIKATASGNQWEIVSGRGERWSVPATVPGAEITMAAYGSGAVFKSADGALRLIPGGLEATGMTLLLPAGVAAPEVKSLYIANDALAWCYLDEAERVFGDARKMFDANLDIIRESWKPTNNERAWQEKFTFLADALDKAKRAAVDRTDGFLPALVADSVLRDRYSWLIWMANNEFAAAGGYFGGEFRKQFFQSLGGMPEAQLATEFARKAERLVAKALRVTHQSFKQGVAWEDKLSAGWVDSLTQVPRPAGLPDRIAKAGALKLARGEAESLQLVLSTQFAPVDKIAVTVKAVDADAPEVRLFKVDYVSLTEPSAPQMPLSRGGDAEIADILEPLKGEQSFDLNSYNNQAVWLDVRAAEATRPGSYRYETEVRVDGKVVMTLPLTVEVQKFALGRNRLQNMAGYRPSSVPSWYGKENDQVARRNLMQCLLDYHLNPLDLYATTPAVEDLKWAIEHGLTAANLGGSLSALAHPEPGMVKFVKLYGSTDGKQFVPVPAKVELVQRDAKNPLSDQDVVVTPEQPVTQYRYLKIHDSETRGWYDRVAYSFVILYPALGDALELTLADGSKMPVKQPEFIQPDKTPATGVSTFEKQPGTFKFDNLRDNQNLGSVIFDKGNAEVKSIRLVNRAMEVALDTMRKNHQAIREIAGKDFTIYLYGFDETLNHLNGRLLSALKNAKIAFPDVTVVSTVGNPMAMPEIYRELDYHCPANAYALPRLNQAMNEECGTQFWTYVGGGGYYPFATIERVDQPLINSRAFFWEPIAFDHIKGFLYWDIHMWRNNDHLKGKNPVDWSLWNTTHGDNNGMAAIFYPGPDNQPFPSLRAAAIRDGIDDYNYVKIAEERLAKLPASEQPAARQELQAIKDKLCTGMSVFCQDPAELSRLREQLIEFINRQER